MDWFLYDNVLHHERIKRTFSVLIKPLQLKNTCTNSIIETFEQETKFCNNKEDIKIVQPNYIRILKCCSSAAITDFEDEFLYYVIFDSMMKANVDDV